MATPRMRPTFECSLPGDADSFYQSLAQALNESGATCRGMAFGGEEKSGAILRRHERDQHFWSPALHLYVRTDEQSRVLVGRFSPSSPVWTGFLALYLTLTCVGICAACYGGAQMILGDTPWAFVGVPIAIALAAFTYGAAFIGQGLGSEDMYELHRFVDRVVEGAARDQVSG
tara:strand:- start:15781 stop:16299 length:519 start_codon:yes stop_codon:yes gene_type:complete